MEKEQEEDKNWEKLKEGLFPPYQHPHPEAFVTRVMAQIAEEPNRNNRQSWLSWRIPAVGLAGLALLTFILTQPMNATVTTADLLLAGTGESPLFNLVFQPEEPKPDQVLALSLAE